MIIIRWNIWQTAIDRVSIGGKIKAVSGHRVLTTHGNKWCAMRPMLSPHFLEGECLSWGVGGSQLPVKESSARSRVSVTTQNTQTLYLKHDAAFSPKLYEFLIRVETKSTYFGSEIEMKFVIQFASAESVKCVYTCMFSLLWLSNNVFRRTNNTSKWVCWHTSREHNTYLRGERNCKENRREVNKLHVFADGETKWKFDVDIK